MESYNEVLILEEAVYDYESVIGSENIIYPKWEAVLKHFGCDWCKELKEAGYEPKRLKDECGATMEKCLEAADGDEEESRQILIFRRDQVKAALSRAYQTALDKTAKYQAMAFEFYDRYDLPLRHLDKADMCKDVTEYLTYQLESGRLHDYDSYFRCNWLHEKSGVMLMLFVYRYTPTKKEIKKKLYSPDKRYWYIRGICRAKDYTEELNESGQIRHWLKTTFENDMKGDWVASQIVRAYIDAQIGAGVRGVSLEGLSQEVKDAIGC
jgi:hypothetical protein